MISTSYYKHLVRNTLEKAQQQKPQATSLFGVGGYKATLKLTNSLS